MTLADLQKGDYGVHVEHGVAVFQGLTRLNVRGVEQDYLLLVYDGDDKLYLPVHRINLVQKYAGPGGSVDGDHKVMRHKGVAGPSQTWDSSLQWSLRPR